MKNFKLIVSAFALVLSFVSTAFTADKMTFAVEGMTCGACEAGVEKKVSAVAGVASVKADHKAKNLVIEAAPGATVDPEAVKKAVSAAGYKVK